MVDTQDTWRKKSRSGFVSENPLSSAQLRAANPLSLARPHASATSTQTKLQPSVPERSPAVSLRRGDTLWEVAQKKLGDGTRWRELRKADGSQFTGQEARRLQVGTQVHLPTKMTAETPSAVTLRSNTPRTSTQVLSPEGIRRRESTLGSTASTKSSQFNVSPALLSKTSNLSSQVFPTEGIRRRELTPSSTPSNRSSQFNASPAAFSTTSKVSSQVPREGITRSNYLNGLSQKTQSTPSTASSNTKNDALNLTSNVATGTAVGIKTKEFFLGRRLEKDPRAIALAERKIKAQLGDDGMKAFRRISDLKSPKEAYAVLRHYIDHASKVPGSKKLLSNLGSRGNTAVGAIGEIRQIPKSRIRISRIELVADKFKGSDGKIKDGADRVYKSSPFSGRKLVVDVKNYNFTSKYYQNPSAISRKNKEFNSQIQRYKEQFPGARIKYEFVGRGRVPSGIVDNLRENGVKVKVPIRVKALETVRAVSESRPGTTLRAARTVVKSRVADTTLRAARTVKNSTVANTTLRAARVLGESRAAGTTFRAARTVKNSTAAKTTLNAAKVLGESKAASVVLRGASKAAAPLAVGLDAVNLYSAYKKDGFGKEFRKEAGRVAGSWGGAAAGAAIGSAIFPGVGTVVGGVIGGVAGSEFGDDIQQGAEKVGKGIVDGGKKVWNKLFG